MPEKFFLYSYKIECSHCKKVFCSETGLKADDLPEISSLIQKSNGNLFCECGQMKVVQWWREPKPVTSSNEEDTYACHPCA